MWSQRAVLKEESTHTAHFTLFFHKDLKVLVDDSDGQQDSSSWADGSQEVGHDWEATYTQASESCSCGDVPKRGFKESFSYIYIWFIESN